MILTPLPMSTNAALLHRFMDLVWSTGDTSSLADYLADAYTIHSDPGDPWEGQVLTREAFAARLQTSRAPFPDLRFEIVATVSEGDCVAIGWLMTGTQTGAMGERAPTGRAIRVSGMTIYDFRDGRISGHRQVVDRMTVARQLGMLG